MIDRVYEALIDRPVHEVFAYATDPYNVPRWVPYVEKVEVRPDGPLGVGSEIVQTVRGREGVWRVTEYVPNAYCKYEAD